MPHRGHAMPRLTPLSDCLGHALAALAPAPVRLVPPADALGATLAADLTFPADLPQSAEALRQGFAVAALDLMGASPQMPLPLIGAQTVQPGAPLPPGTDALLPEEDVETGGNPSLPLALRAPAPGEGIRRAGHEARAGASLAQAGDRVTPRLALIAELAGLKALALRRPRVRLDLPDPAQHAFLRAWLRGEGAAVVTEAPDLVLRRTSDHRPRLALAPGESAWLGMHEGCCTLHLPTRFDGMIAAVLALGRPVLAALSGRAPEPARPLVLSRKLSSVIGVTELALLAPGAEGWAAEPAGLLTLSGLARARAFTLIPPESEGYAAGSTVPAFALEPTGAEP